MWYNVEGKKPAWRMSVIYTCAGPGVLFVLRVTWPQSSISTTVRRTAVLFRIPGKAKCDSSVGTTCCHLPLFLLVNKESRALTGLHTAAILQPGKSLEACRGQGEGETVLLKADQSRIPSWLSQHWQQAQNDKKFLGNVKYLAMKILRFFSFAS